MVEFSKYPSKQPQFEDKSFDLFSPSLEQIEHTSFYTQWEHFPLHYSHIFSLFKKLPKGQEVQFPSKSQTPHELWQGTVQLVAEVSQVPHFLEHSIIYIVK